MSIFFQNFPTIQYDIYGNGKLYDVVDISRAVRLKKNIKDDILLYTYYNIQDGERPDHVSQRLYGSQNFYWTFFMINDTLTNVYEDWPLSRAELDNKIAMKYSGYVIKTTSNISNILSKGETLVGLVSGSTAVVTEKDPNLGLVRITNLNGMFLDNEIVRGLDSNDIFTVGTVVQFALAPHHYENTSGDTVQRTSPGAIPITNTDYEISRNEEKAKIKVIRKEYINAMSEEFFKQINPEEE